MSEYLDRRRTINGDLDAVEEGSVFDYSVSAGSRNGTGRDDLSLAYSVDARSAAETHISAASDEVSRLGEPYYHPALPTPVENEAPPPEPQEPEEPSVFQAFIASPMDYIFGGNDDDDLSTLGGFENSFQWGNDDNSTIATNPTVTEAFRKQQPTIYEESDEDASSGYSQSRSIHTSNHDDYKSYVSEASMSQADEQFYKGTGTYATQGKGGNNIKTMSDHSTATPYSKESESIKSWNQNQSYANQSYENQSYAKGLHSTGSSRFSVTDEQNARSHMDQDDASISLSQVFDEVEEVKVLPRREPEQWSAYDSDSVRSSRSEVWRRSAAKNQSWRSAKSARTSAYSTGSSRTTGSGVMPETPQVVPGKSHGGPLMTRGMSGRAVVHVKMDHNTEGTIERLDYTMPLIDAPPPLDMDDVFNDEDTVTAGNKEHLPWYDYYFARSKIVRTCHSKQCYRINAMILVAVTLILTASISITSVMTEARGQPYSSASSQTARNTAGTVSLHDLAAPTQISGVRLPTFLDTRLKDWFNADGHNAAHADDVPFYFHIPIAGALIASKSWNQCLGFTIASDGGKAEVSNTTLKTMQRRGSSFVNVDVTTPLGIQHAAQMGLVPSGLPDVLVSPLFADVIENLYSKSFQTTLMMTMRNPVDRAVAMFEYMKTATSDPSYNPALAAMTLEQYALSGFIQNNYVVRLLTGKFRGTLTIADVNLCKELLRRKALVGTYEQMETSLMHFERYFGWTQSARDVLSCQAKHIQDGYFRESTIKLDRGSSAYVLIRQQNLFDISLYEYIHNILVPFQTEAILRQAEMPSGGGGIA